jgi:hypothetical protein
MDGGRLSTADVVAATGKVQLQANQEHEMKRKKRHVNFAVTGRDGKAFSNNPGRTV